MVQSWRNSCVDIDPPSSGYVLVDHSYSTYFVVWHFNIDYAILRLIFVNEL